MLIEKAVAMISEGGIEQLSVSALAREADMNRSTVYYHFDSREALLAEVKTWLASHLASAFSPHRESEQAMARVMGFALDNPVVLKLWIDDAIAPGEVRERFPGWDDLVTRARHALTLGGEEGDPEVFCAMLLAASFIAPRIFQLSVSPGEPAEAIVARFMREQRRLTRGRLLPLSAASLAD